jgi:hypothetical protein
LCLLFGDGVQIVEVRMDCCRGCSGRGCFGVVIIGVGGFGLLL